MRLSLFLLLPALFAETPLPLKRTELTLTPPRAGWEIDFVSSAAVAKDGTMYLFQRGKKAQPILAVDRSGKVLREWGEGLFEIPHSIRVDPKGNIWVVDAKSSNVFQFTPEGKQLLKIAVGGQPESKRGGFGGTSDIAFGPNGRLFISDGYGNARILEYASDGKKVREWGKPGTGPGEFHLPHGIAIGPDNTVYVADRENGRVQLFDLDGKFLREWPNTGKTFSITYANNAIWIGTQPLHLPNGAPGWLKKLDPKTGAVLGSVDSNGHHSVAVFPNGELLTGVRPNLVLWFR